MEMQFNLQFDMQTVQMQHNNNNNNNNVYGAVIVQSTLKVHLAHMMNVAANLQPRPTDPACESTCRLPIGCKKLHPPSAFIIITQPES